MKVFMKLLGAIVALSLILCVIFSAYTLYQIYYWKKVGTYTADLGDISAFSSSYSFFPGDPVPLLAHTTKDAEARLYRLGATLEDMNRTVAVPKTLQNAAYSVQEGVDWTPVADVDTTGLQPGLYAVEIKQVDSEAKPFWLSFVLKSRSPKPITVIASTYTWESYNDFGGISRYVNTRINSAAEKFLKFAYERLGIRTPSAVMATKRPNVAVSEDLAKGHNPMEPAFSKMVRGEWALIAFLEREGYDYAVYTDHDMVASPEPLNASIVVLNGHCEYWTQEMIYAFENYIHRGGRAFVTAGNPIFRPVEIRGNSLRFAMEDLPRSYISSLIGAFYTNEGQGSSAPFRVRAADHWVFKNTGLTNGATFGERSLSLPLPQPPSNGDPYPDGASGGYTSKIGEGSGAFVRLADGLNAEGAANMVYRDTEAGGWVFNTASLLFTGALLIDPVVAQITRNVLEEGISKAEGKRFVHAQPMD